MESESRSGATGAASWGARQRQATVAVYGASSLAGRELVRTLLEAAHPPTQLRLYDANSRTLSFRDRPLLIRTPPEILQPVHLAFLASDPRGDLERLLAARARVIDLSGRVLRGEQLPVYAVGVCEDQVGPFSQGVRVPRGPAGWIAALLGALHGLAGLAEASVTWIAPAASEGLDALLALRAERSGTRSEGAPAPRLGRVSWSAPGGLVPDPSRSERPVGLEPSELQRLLGIPGLPVETTTLRGDSERSDAVQVHVRLERGLEAGRAAAAFERLAGVRVTTGATSAGGALGTAAVAGRSHVEVVGLRAGSRGTGSLSFFATGDHLLAGAVRAALAAARVLPLG